MIFRSIFFQSVLLANLVLVSYAVADLRVATVDIGKILNESSMAKSERVQLDRITADARRNVTLKQTDLEKLKKEVTSQTQSQGTQGSDSQILVEYRQKVRDLERLVKDKEDQIQSEFIKSNNKITEKTLSAIKAYASQKGIDLVLDKSAMKRGPVLFATETADITKDIIARLED
jgi:outer membrane protein